jgi:hypothetical protein
LRGSGVGSVAITVVHRGLTTATAVRRRDPTPRSSAGSWGPRGVPGRACDAYRQLTTPTAPCRRLPTAGRPPGCPSSAPSSLPKRASPGTSSNPVTRARCSAPPGFPHGGLREWTLRLISSGLASVSAGATPARQDPVARVEAIGGLGAGVGAAEWGPPVVTLVRRYCARGGRLGCRCTRSRRGFRTWVGGRTIGGGPPLSVAACRCRRRA